MTQWTIRERPVQRCPRTGLLNVQPAFEGWSPKPSKPVSSWWLVLVAVGLVVLARGVL